MYCPNCGKPVPDKAAYCIQCGAPVPKRKAPKKKKTWLLIPVIAVLGLCFIIAGLFSGVRVQKLDETKAQEIMKSNPSMDYTTAIAKAWEDPALMAEYDAEYNG